MCLGTTCLMKACAFCLLHPRQSSLWATPFVSVYEGGLLPTHNLAHPAHTLAHKPSGTSSSPTVIPSPRRLRQYPPPPPPPPPTTASPLSPPQSRFTLVSAAPARPRPPPVHAARSLESAPTSQSIASRRSSPRAARPYDCRAIPMRFPTTHGVRGGAPTPRCSSATWARSGLAPRDNTRAGGVWLGPIRPSIHPSGPESRVPSHRAFFVLLEEGTPRRAPTHPPSEAIGSLPRFEKIKNAESGRAECRAVRCTRGLTAPARSRVLSTPCVRARDVDVSLPIARHPSSSIFRLLLPPNVARTTHERLLYFSTAVLSIGAAAPHP
ncbi:hypothetical protein B0H14DRAFT_1686502 [Mycena olivaceomarginata]|nr:hypothetical protein B0H14DRAFT_1686502 [Mycena olivaceomarginata]